MKLDDDVTHHGVIDGALGGGLPRCKCQIVIWKYADNIEMTEIAEFVAVEGCQFATKD